MENEMGETCSTYFGEDKCIAAFWWKKLKERKEPLRKYFVDGGSKK
jgi:hypothetical protein